MALHIRAHAKNTDGGAESLAGGKLVVLVGKLRTVTPLLGRDPLATLYNVLEAEYPGAVAEVGAGVRYKYVYCPEIEDFKRVCCAEKRWEIDAGGEVLVVSAEVGMDAGAAAAPSADGQAPISRTVTAAGVVRPASAPLQASGG